MNRHLNIYVLEPQQKILIPLLCLEITADNKRAFAALVSYLATGKAVTTFYNPGDYNIDFCAKDIFEPDAAVKGRLLSILAVLTLFMIVMMKANLLLVIIVFLIGTVMTESSWKTIVRMQLEKLSSLGFTPTVRYYKSLLEIPDKLIEQEQKQGREAYKDISILFMKEDDIESLMSEDIIV